jgi:tetratricopeptide (TPR) repeat protein
MVLLILTGCGSEKQAVTSEVHPPQKDLIASDPSYRAAMDHFMDGNLNDIQGEFAQAILDYQEALRDYRDPAILDAMAQDYMRLGKSDMAVETAHEAVALAPRNINYRRTLAQGFLSEYNADSAIVEYSSIISIDSTQVEDLIMLAQLYQRSDPSKAAALYRKALELNGPDIPTMMQLVQIYNSMNEFDKSIGVLEEMLKVDPSNEGIKEALSDLYLQTDKNEEALKILDGLMQSHNGDFNLKARAATAYLRMKDIGRADSLINVIFTSDSSRADAKFAIAQFYLDEMQHDSAVVPFAQEIFNRLMSLYPNDARSYLVAGLGASYANQDSLAEAYLGKSISIDSTNQNSWQAIAVLYYQKNDFVKMADAMSRAVNIFPSNFRLNLFYGLALNRSGRNAEAVKPLEKAVSLKPTDMDALSTLALVYEALSRYDDAYRVYDTALKVDGKNSLILNNYAYSLSERGLDLEKALKMAQLAVQLDPKNSAFLDTIGWVYFKLGDYKNAESYVKEALSIRAQPGDGSPATLEEHLGDIYEKMGNITKAVEYWEKALGHNPQSAELRDKIAKAKS